jgi:23S rRNA pseudouridine1911/1915/1917 synthase
MMNELSFRILYCDSDCVVVNKIAGEAVEGAGKTMVDLPRMLAEALDSQPGLQTPAKDALALPVAVHRLDVPVSGCVLFARNESALRFLNNSFNTVNISKIYWAVVEQPQNNALIADTPTYVELVHWIQFDSQKNKSTAFDQPKPGLKKAILRYRPVGRGEKYLFLEVELNTGRHHQIRAQFERLGLHIKGDLKYGARRSEPSGGIRLHARSLSFPHPADKRIGIQADPPVCDNLWRAFMDASTSSVASLS